MRRRSIRVGWSQAATQYEVATFPAEPLNTSRLEWRCRSTRVSKIEVNLSAHSSTWRLEFVARARNTHRLALMRSVSFYTNRSSSTRPLHRSGAVLLDFVHRLSGVVHEDAARRIPVWKATRCRTGWPTLEPIMIRTRARSSTSFTASLQRPRSSVRLRLPLQMTCQRVPELLLRTFVLLGDRGRLAIVRDLVIVQPFGHCGKARVRLQFSKIRWLGWQNLHGSVYLVPSARLASQHSDEDDRA